MQYPPALLRLSFLGSQRNESMQHHHVGLEVIWCSLQLALKTSRRIRAPSLGRLSCVRVGTLHVVSVYLGLASGDRHLLVRAPLCRAGCERRLRWKSSVLFANSTAADCHACEWEWACGMEVRCFCELDGKQSSKSRASASRITLHSLVQVP